LRPALRSRQAAPRGRSLRALRSSALLERFGGPHELLPHPPAAALGSPREPVARLPGAAAPRRRPAASHGLLRHAAARPRAASVVRGDESEAARASLGTSPPPVPDLP